MSSCYQHTDETSATNKFWYFFCSSISNWFNLWLSILNSSFTLIKSTWRGLSYEYVALECLIIDSTFCDLPEFSCDLSESSYKRYIIEISKYFKIYFESSLTLSPISPSFCRVIVMSNLRHNVDDSLYCPVPFSVKNYYSVFFKDQKRAFNCSYLLVCVTY